LIGEQGVQRDVVHSLGPEIDDFRVAKLFGEKI
jgi:hypothetical protein